MSENPNRRSLLAAGGRWLPALSAAALVTAGAAPAQASPGTGRRGPALAGTWEAFVNAPEVPSFPGERGIFAFTEGGVLIGTAGSGRLLGLGTWKATGRRAFALDYRHFIIGADDTISGEVHISQQGVLESPDRFVADGPARQLDADGDVVGTVQSHTVGDRYGFRL